MGVTMQIANSRRADAEHGEAQLLEDHCDRLLERVVAGSGGAHQRPAIPTESAPSASALATSIPSRHTTTGNQHITRRGASRADERLGGRNPPAGE